MQHTITLQAQKGGVEGAAEVTVETSLLQDLGEVIDCSHKKYDVQILAGFTLHVECGVFDQYPELLCLLLRDFEEVTYM